MTQKRGPNVPGRTDSGITYKNCWSTVARGLGRLRQESLQERQNSDHNITEDYYECVSHLPGFRVQSMTREQGFFFSLFQLIFFSWELSTVYGFVDTLQGVELSWKGKEKLKFQGRVPGEHWDSFFLCPVSLFTLAIVCWGCTEDRRRIRGAKCYFFGSINTTWSEDEQTKSATLKHLWCVF